MSLLHTLLMNHSPDMIAQTTDHCDREGRISREDADFDGAPRSGDLGEEGHERPLLRRNLHLLRTDSGDDKGQNFINACPPSPTIPYD